MSRAGFTTTECPACHQKKERKQNEVCPDCLELIERGKHFDRVYNELKQMTATLVESRVPDEWSKPYYSPHKIGYSGSDIYHKIESKIVELAVAVSLPSPVNIRKWSYMSFLDNRISHESSYSAKNSVFTRWPERPNERFEYEQDRIFEKKVHDLLSELDDLIREGIKETEKRSIEYGKNLLLQLNNGDITPTQFLEG